MLGIAPGEQLRDARNALAICEDALAITRREVAKLRARVPAALLAVGLALSACGGDCRDTGCPAGQECLPPEEGGPWVCGPERKP